LSPRRAALAAALAVAAVPTGCGGGGDRTTTVTREIHTVTVTNTDTTQSKPPARGDAGAEPQAVARDEAERYARRTYVVQPQLGRRVFAVSGPGVAVTAADGSRITAFGALLADSGDGTGQAVLLFRGARFLGWASDRLAVRLRVEREGSDIAVRYGVFQGNDPLCCASSTRTVRYSWNGTRVVADGDPPLSYGKPGDRLRLAPQS
jgi:hypothetical protein